MKVTNKTYIELTMQELKQYTLWALEAQGQISGNSECEIVVVDESTDVNGWFCTPENWRKPYCPHEDLIRDSTIEVIYRNGESMIEKASFWLSSWIQDDDQYDIIKYRVINKKY